MVAILHGLLKIVNKFKAIHFSGETPLSARKYQIDCPRFLRLNRGGTSTRDSPLILLYSIPIPGFRTVEQALDNAEAMEFGPLSSDQVAQVQAITAQ
jgi:hypothetical protein